MAQERSTHLSDDDLRAEIQDLRTELLQTMVCLAAFAAALLFLLSVSEGDSPGPLIAPTLLVILSSIACHRAAGRYYGLCTGVFILSLGMALAIVSSHYPFAPIAFLTTLPIILAAFLLGGLASLLVGLGTWGLMTYLWSFTEYALWLLPHRSQLLFVYMATCVVAWLASQALRRMVRLALDGWSQARRNLEEIQEQRGELNKVVKALEEANYRTERANHDLGIYRRQAEEALALKARFAATISHELRGPLHLILGFSKLMCLFPENYGESLPASYRGDIYTVYRSSQHLLALVDDVLDLSQIEAQQLPLVKDRVDIAEDVIRRALDIVEPLIRRKRLSLDVKIESDLPWILADAVRLRQALLNILNNAVRLTEIGGIGVTAFLEESSIIVRVSDTGPGIADADKDLLFREFSRLGTTAAEDEKGSGLGLAITQHLIQLHGGHVSFESELGRGTIFSIALPVAIQELPRSTVSTGAVREQSRAPVCVVVHDEPAIVRLLARHLHGYQIVNLPGVNNLVPTIVDLHPRAVLASFEFTDRVEAELAQHELRIPVVSCQLPRLTSQRAFRNVISYLTKPLSSELLMAQIGRTPGLDNGTVLMVDDDPDALDLLGRTLTSLPRPFRLIRAHGGEQAIALMKRSPPNLVILDMVMEGMDGLAVLRSMERDAELSSIPVIVLSGRDWVDDTVSVGSKLVLTRSDAFSLADGSRCVGAVLDTLSPDYSSDLSASLSSVAAVLG